MFFDFLKDLSGFLTFFEAPPKSKARRLAYDALLGVFGADKDRLKRFLKLQLDQDLDTISTAGNLRDIIFAVVLEAENEGWLTNLLTKAKGEFPENPEFVAKCDQALSWLEVDRQKQVEAEKAPPPARRINLILAITFVVLLTIWALVLFGWTTVWYVVAALGAWLATNVLQFLFELEKLRRIDQFLGVVLGSPRTTYMLGGLLIFGIVGSLFVGSVQAPPEDDQFDVRIARLAEDHIGKRLDPGHVRAFPTMLGWPREVTVWADGYQPRPVKIWPWWRQRLRVADGDFHLTPYVLIAADNQLAPSIHNKHPWELEIRVNDKTSKLINFYGEFVLLGDTDRQPNWIKKRNRSPLYVVGSNDGTGAPRR